MASISNKTLSTVYKDLLHTNSSNSGLHTSNLERIQAGDGDNSPVKLSQNSCKIIPTDTDSTTAFSVDDKDGNNLLAVDSTNDLVKAGVGSHTVNTQYSHFGTSYVDTATYGFLANTHYAIPFGGGFYGDATAANYAFGTSTNPDASLTISTTAMSIIRTYWHVMDDITIDRVIWWSAGDAATGDTTRAHLMSYSVASTAGSTSGDLSSGTVLADGSDITNAGYEQAYYQQMTIQSANVDAGKIILFLFRSDSVNSDFSINVTVKYHLR